MEKDKDQATEKATICFTTTKEVHAKLKKEASKDERSVSKLIHLILKKALK